jgi:hypothetical protein
VTADLTVSGSPPTLGQVLLAVVCVLLLSLAGFAVGMAGWRRRNAIAAVFTLGAALLVAGIVGQRVFPSPDTVRRLGSAAARTAPPGPFDAGVSIPVVNLSITPVALVGILIAALGLSLLLVFEPAMPPVEPAPLRPLHDDDTI